ncbi:phospholipase D/nuclease [Hesseltinella vesiculosa]|uniref:Phospholipase D/nuclease n=1 Tax=Hesseltinella vesiculosa TaxID=101127 RepID=A0A1X2GE93_9FUNG|nr:phospholipase D/nuclease [Hesseltinella vesiculosa]
MKGVLDSSGKRVVIQPPLHNERYGCFHPKLMLLFYEGSMRVVIGSANLVSEPYDYNELDNVVFIQDFPERPSTDPPCGINDLPQFARDIADLLDRMQVPRSVKQTLAKYDFSKAKAKIVASVSGVFEGDDDYKKFGHPRLATVIEQIGAADPLRPPRVEMQTSSLGAMTVQYLNELYTSFSGRDPYDNPAMRKMYKKPTSLPPINIVFPTWQTVERSKLGPPGAGTIFLSSEHWAKPTFPKSVMCDAISHRSGTLMHTKHVTFVYVMSCRSHNATAAAWGRLTLSKEKLPKLTMSNWELGVVLPMDKNSEYPSPYVRPAPKYRSDQQPWLQDLYHGFS